MQLSPNTIAIYDQLENVRKLLRISNEKMGKSISYSGEGLKKALLNKRLSDVQILQIIKTFNLESHFTELIEFESKKENDQDFDTTSVALSRFKPEEICMYIFENKSIFKDNPVYKMLLENEIKEDVIKELEKYKRKLETDN